MEINYDDVEKIGSRAFEGKSNIKKLIIDCNIKEIGDRAFYGCKNLEEVIINAGDDEELTIGFEAFANCENLKIITIYRSDIDVQENSFTINDFETEENKTTTIEILRCTEGNIKELYSNYKFINEKKTQKITLKKDNGEADETKNINYGARLNEDNLQAPKKEGYTFDGWYLGNAKYDFNKVVLKDFTLTAHWKINQYIVTFVFDNGEDNLTLTQDYNTKINYPNNPARTGYTFTGWDKIITIVPAENVTINAQWNINQYTITFILNNNEPSRIIIQDYGTEIKLESIPTGFEKVGHTFAGWDKPVPATMPAENMTITAEWSVNQYKLTFVLNNGEQNIERTQDYGTPIVSPSNLVKTGYSFTGWSSSVPETIPAENLVFTAQWSKNTYTIIIVLDNGEPDITISQEYDTEIDLSVVPSSPEKVGYTFIGWDKEIPTKMPAYDVTINAEWTPIVYKITLDNCTGNAEDNFEIYLHYSYGFYSSSDLNNEIISVNIPINGYYIFCGYYGSVENNFTINPTGTNQVIDENGNILLRVDAITENKTYYAMWKFETYGVSYTLSSDGTYYTATSFDNNSGYEDVIILESIDSIPVKTIRYNVFQYCDNLISVTIPNSVTNIGTQAFTCSNLTDVYYNGTLSDWCKISFRSRDSNPMYHAQHFHLKNINGEYEELTEIVIPSDITEIKAYTFYGFNNVTKVNISNHIMSIHQETFNSCDNLIDVYYNGTISDWCKISFDSNPMICAQHFYLKNSNEEYDEITEIVIPSDITEIKNFTFLGFKNVTKVTIPNSVISIGEITFYDCNSLTSIVIPSSVKSIGYCAFYNCSSLTSVTIEKNSQLTSIGGNAFQNCYNLTSITIPSSVTSIGGGAFSGCSSLTSVTFEENSQLTSIGSSFSFCHSLTSITIPSSVTSIGNYAFWNCSSLTDVYFDGTESEWNEISIGSNNEYLTNATIHFKYSLGLAYNLSSDETYYIVSGIGTCTDTDIIIPSEYNGKPVKKIADGAFLGNSNLKSITIPSSVTSIGESAFEYCTRLTSVTFEDNSQLTSIGSSAFEECINLKSVSFGDNSQLTTIGYAAFDECSDLTSITFGKNSKLTSIGGSAFFNCSSLTSIEIPSSVTSIGDSAFNGCSSLTSITIPNNVTSIGVTAFSSCSSLTSVVFENPNGWKVSVNSNMSNSKSISSSNLSNSSIAATYLTSTYTVYTWKRS